MSAFLVSRDRGAHFYKCDFQVHTPRDAMWSGTFSRAVTDAGRAAFAEALVADAMRKGLNAIAITDHHDLCLWPAVKKAAEQNTEGKAFVVFPGVELTLSSPPAQALLLLDPDLSEEALAQIWGALGITPIPSSASTCGSPIALRRDLDLNSIYMVLSGLAANPEQSSTSERKPLAQRFILLPHVHQSGHKTLLRKGQYKDYSEMPCVGGYIEGCLYTELKPGNRDILEGRSTEWGNKAIGVFQTSDSRSAEIQGTEITFPTLGKWPTWVKWTEPTAEALRQACLARDSRIIHSEPGLPRLRLLGVEVSDSEFLGSCSLWLNPQFNSFIGGRGTGKSSLLEYIRWGLCDDPAAAGATVAATEELPDYQKRRKSLIEKTLRPIGGRVTVYYEKFGVIYRIMRSSEDSAERVLVTTIDGASREIKGDQARKEFPIIAYAQKQLSVVGTLPDEVRRLVTDPIRERLSNIDREIAESALPALKKARQRWVRLHQLTDHIREATEQLEGKRAEIAQMRSRLSDVSEEDSRTIAAHDTYNAEARWVDAIENSIEQTRAAFAQAGQLAETKLRYHDINETWPHANAVAEIAAAVDQLREYVRTQITAVVAVLDAFPTAAASTASQRIRADMTGHTQAYNESVARAANSQRELTDIQAIEIETAEIEKRRTAYSDEAQTLTALNVSPSGDPWNHWVQLHQARTAVLEEQATLLTQQADHAFNVSVRPYANVTPIRSKLEMLVSCGKNIRAAEDKISSLCEQVITADSPLDEWLKVVDEFRSLLDARGGATLPTVQHLASAGFSSLNLASLRDYLDAQILEDVRYVPLLDDIVFEFTFGKDENGAARYIPFQDASPGQQATVLLKALLGQQGPPLLIDQPEEDLDNEQVNVIADYIRRTKHFRQLLFVSHNANLVVNGDSELVACFGYRNAGDQTAATVIQEGSIDYAPVRDLVTSVMEGGRAAFELRRQKYNF